MSLTLLLEKYDVSTEEGLQKALSEIEKEECEVNEALCNALSRACTLEGRLRAASQAYSKLGEVRNDTQVAADMVDKTALLARDVSAKVRQLDLARSRVAECQRRVHDLIDLRVCSAGVDTALKAHDYETAAGHVARFLSMEPGSVEAARARGAPDPRRDMDAAANTLRDHLVRKFEEASKKEDEASIERLFKLFPQFGRAEEGVDLLAKYLASQLEVSIRRAATVSELRLDAAVFADSLTRVLESGASAVERARRLLAAAAAPPSVQTHALLPRAIAIMQPTICAGVRRVSQQMVAARKLAAADRADPLGAEHALNELALAHSRLQLYLAFLRRRAEVDTTLDAAAKAAFSEAVEKIIAGCDTTRTAQDVLSHYLTLERYFLEESVNKALKMSSNQTAATTSSLVDDVFFIARKVIRRSISTGSVDGACAVLNEAGAALERCGAALRRRLAAPPLEPLAFPAPPARLAVARDLDAQRALYLAHMNEAEAGAEWSERLAAEACREAEALVRGADTARAKLRSCAAGLGAAAAAFRAAHDLALAALRAALLPTAAAWADALVDPDTDAEELGSEAGALPAALEQLAEQARLQLPRAADALLAGVLADLLARAERAMLNNHYDRVTATCIRSELSCRPIVNKSTKHIAAHRSAPTPEVRGHGGTLLELFLACFPKCWVCLWQRLSTDGASIVAMRIPCKTVVCAQRGGARVERRCRRVAAWAGAGAPGARERAGALSAAAGLLALERAAHAPDALPPSAPLPAARVRDVLARRTDFKLEDIKRLKL
ncbi:conserved oligomeric Golgi complex subunit 4 [Pararge aegeria]|uniref:conserved oligomeric Golgi complex subunit 4 n=1 Tax=Pararge aegeria TaxID=116150 RepID=UPI0019D24B70|nr:conserved oligomeric Golgi complex subunit 4 [Pararge aegeria]